MADGGGVCLCLLGEGGEVDSLMKVLAAAAAVSCTGAAMTQPFHCLLGW